MSSSPRVVFRRLEIEEELLVTPADERASGEPPAGFARPQPADLAQVLATVDSEWFAQFLKQLRALGFERCVEVAVVLGDITKADLWSDDDCGFGADPGDSARLLELYQAIDAIGWNSPEDEEKGDYLGRLKQIREELSGVATAALQQQLDRLAAKARRQRQELRRFNREARLVAETTANVAARKLLPNKPVATHHRYEAWALIGSDRTFEIGWRDGSPRSGALHVESERHLLRLQELAQAIANTDEGE